MNIARLLKYNQIIFATILSLLFSVSCTLKGDSDLEKTSEIIIAPGDLLQVSSKEFYEYSDKDFSFYLREVDDNNKLNTILDVTPDEADRKAGATVYKSIIPKGVNLTGTYVIEVVMDNFPDYKLNALYIPDSVIVPGVASTLTWEALTSDPNKKIKSYSKDDVVSIYNWINNFIPGHKQLFGITTEISFVQLYKFIRNGLANNLEFINFLNSLGTGFNYDNLGNYVSGPILFGQIKYPPILDPTLTRPSPGDVAIKEAERLIFQTYGRDLAGDMVFYSWQLKNDDGAWEMFDSNTNVTSWTPDYGDARKTPYEFRVLVSNGGPFALWNGSTIPAWSVYVSPNVRAPSITEIDCPKEAYVRTEYTCQLKATDPSGYKLKWIVYPDPEMFAYIYVNGTRIDDSVNPPTFEPVDNVLTIKATPLNVDGIQYPTFRPLVKVTNQPSEYPELAASDSKRVQFTVSDNAKPPSFQAMARPYSNWNPVVFNYDLKNDLVSIPTSQSPSYISESFINKSINGYEFGPLRQWDGICNVDPDTGNTPTNVKNDYYFQVKVKSDDDFYAATGATSGKSSSASDHKDRYQFMEASTDDITVSNLSLQQLLEVDDPDRPGSKIDLLATNYNETDHTSVFHYKINLASFVKSNLQGEKYGVKVCSDHTGPPPELQSLCAELGFAFQVESRTPCVKIASNGTALSADERNKPFRKDTLSSLSAPTKLNIQAAGSTGDTQSCTTQNCSMGADLDVQLVPTGMDYYADLRNLPFLQNVTRVTRKNTILADTNSIFVMYRNSGSDPFSFQLPYPDPLYNSDYPVGTPLDQIPPDLQKAARQEVNTSAYALVPGYVVLRSATNNPERFGILSYFPPGNRDAYPSRPDLQHLSVVTDKPLPVRNRLVANYNVVLPGTGGVSRSVQQYFMIPTRTRPSSLLQNSASDTTFTNAGVMGNSMCRMQFPSDTTRYPDLSGFSAYGTYSGEPTNSSRNYTHRYARMLDYTYYGNTLFNVSLWLNDPVLEVATPVWPCFPGEDLRLNSSVELIKTSADSNNYSGISYSFKEGPDFLGNNAHFTHYPLEIGYKGQMISYVVMTKSSALPSTIPKGTYFIITKNIKLEAIPYYGVNLPGSGDFVENFIFKTNADYTIKSGSLTANIPVTLAWEDMQIPSNSLQWDSSTWQFSFQKPADGTSPASTVNVTSALWTVIHPQFYPFLGWNRFDVNLADNSQSTKLKFNAQNRMTIEIGEVVKFNSTESIVKKLTSNAPPVSSLNEVAIYGNSGKVKVFNNSTDPFVYDASLNYWLTFKSSAGAIFNPTASFTVPSKGELEVSVNRSLAGSQEPVSAFGLSIIESSNPSHNDFLGQYPFLTVRNNSVISGYTSDVSISNNYSQDVTIDITKTTVRTRSGIQFKFQGNGSGNFLTFAKNSTVNYSVERDYNQTNPDISEESEITFTQAEYDYSTFNIGVRNAVDIDKDFLAATTSAQTVQSGSSMTELNLGLYEAAVGTSSVVSPFSLIDLYESYSYFVDLGSASSANPSTPLPSSCTPSSYAFPGTCQFKLCRYSASVDPSCATTCNNTSIMDSRFCHVRFLSASADVDTQGRSYNFVVKSKSKVKSGNSQGSLTVSILVTEANVAPIMSFINGDASNSTIISDSTKYFDVSTISSTLGSSTSSPYDTSIQNTYAGASSSVNFAGFIEGQTMTVGKDNSYRIFARSTTKTKTYSELSAQVSEFYYYNSSNVLTKEINNATDSPNGIPKGLTVGTTVQPAAVKLTCVTMSGQTANSCNDDVYGSLGYTDIRWTPTDLQTKKYSHANGVILKVDFCSNCSSSTEPKKSVYYKFKIVNKNVSTPSFILDTASSNFTIPDEGANISNGVKNNVINSSDKSEIKVYADSYLKFTIKGEDSDGYSPLGSTWATVLSLCRNNTDENSSQTCAFDTWYGTDFTKISNNAKTTYDGNQYLSDGVTLNSGCRNTNGTLRTDLIIPKISSSTLTSTASGKRQYQFVVEWCPQRTHLGKYTGSIFLKDFGDVDRQGTREASKENSVSLKFNVVSRPYFISPSFNYDIGSTNPTNANFKNNHFMRQAYADSTTPFEYYFNINNSLKNPVTFTIGSPYTATSGCSVNTTTTSCTLSDGDADSTNDVVLKLDPNKSDLAIMTWSPNTSNLSANINSPRTFRIQVKDTVTNLSDNVYFSVLVKNRNYPSALYGASDSTVEVGPQISSLRASLKDKWNQSQTYEQTFDGTNYIYNPTTAQTIEMSEGQTIDFNLLLNMPADQNPYDTLFVRWFMDGSLVNDNDLAASETASYQYAPDNTAAGAQVVYAGSNLPRGYHILRAEVTDGSMKDYREWYIKVRNLLPTQDTAASFDLTTTRQSLVAQTVTALSWGQEMLVNYSSDSTKITDHLVVSANYKASNQDKQGVWNIQFINGTPKLTVNTGDPALYNEGINLNPKAIARMDYKKESSGFKVYLTSESRRLQGYQTSGSNAIVTDVYPKYTSVNPAPCTDTCTTNYFDAGDDSTAFDTIVDRGSGDLTQIKFNVVGTRTVKLFATSSTDRKSVNIDKGNFDSLTNLSAAFALPTQLEIRALAFSHLDNILYVATSTASGAALTVIKRISFSKIAANTSGISSTLVQGVDYDILSDITIKNGSSDFDYKINGAHVIPGPNTTDTLQYRVAFLAGNISGGGGALIIVNPNGNTYTLKRDASNTLSSSTTDVPGKGKKLLYSTRDQVLVGLVMAAGQYFIYDPYTQTLNVSSKSGSLTPSSLAVSPTGLMLVIDRAAGKVYQLK